MILYLSCLWATERNTEFSKGFEKCILKWIKKVLDKQERTWYDLKVAAVLMKNGSTKWIKKVLDKLRTKWYNDKASYTKRITKRSLTTEQ